MKLSMMMFRSAFVTALLVMACSAFAQHSYLPAQDAGGKITPLIDPDGGGPLPFQPDYVATNAFTTALAGNVYRAGGPSGFMQDIGSASFPAGFSALLPNSDLTITNPLLSHSLFSGSGNFLYWDGAGSPNFGPAPANTSITIYRLMDADLSFRATLDGGASAVGPWVEDHSTATAGRSGHFHLQYDVVGDAVSAANEAPNGVYLLGHVLGMSGLGDSDTVYVPLLKNTGADPLLLEAFNSAVSFVETSVVPEPTVGVLMIAGGAGLTLLGRRRGSNA